MSWESFKNDATSITTVFATKLNGLKEASKIHNINFDNYRLFKKNASANP